VRAPEEHIRSTIDVSSLLTPGDITAVTQPIVRVADGVTVGFEVLARSRSFSFTSPDQWLVRAEAAGCRTEVELACLRAELAEQGARAAIDVSSLTSAALWWYGPNGVELGAAAGVTTFTELDAASVEKLFAFEAAARAMLVVALRSHGATLGLLVATSGRSRDIGSDVVEATELLGLHIAATAAGYPPNS
jgi:hypothetical protein